MQDSAQQTPGDLTVLLSFVYPQTGGPGKVKIIDTEHKQYNDLLDTDFSYGGSMFSGSCNCVRTWELEKDNTVHRFGLLNKSSDSLQEFDDRGNPLVKLVTSGCQLVATVVDGNDRVLGLYIFSLDDLSSVTVKETTETYKSSNGETYTSTHRVLPFPSNNFGLVGIEYRGPNGKQFPAFGCVGNIYIETDTAKNFKSKEEVHPMYC